MEMDQFKSNFFVEQFDSFKKKNYATPSSDSV